MRKTLVAVALVVLLVPTTLLFLAASLAAPAPIGVGCALMACFWVYCLGAGLSAVIRIPPADQVAVVRTLTARLGRAPTDEEVHAFRHAVPAARIVRR